MLSCLLVGNVQPAFAQTDEEDQSMSMDAEYEMEMNGDMGMDMDMDMNMDMEMGMDMGGGQRGARRGATGGGSLPEAILQAHQASLASLVTSMDLSPLSADSAQFGAKLEAGPELGNDAKTAYQSGNYEAALQLHFAHMVTEYDQARVGLQTVKYSQLLRRPIWQIRWGVSYAVRGEEEATDPSPIIAGKTTPMSGGGMGMNGDDMGMEMGMGMGEEEDMQSGMDMEMEMEMSMDMEMGMDMDMGGPGGQGRRASGPAAPITVTRTMLDPNAKSQLDKYLGLVAEVIQEEFTKRYRQGDFGVALVTVNSTEAPDAAVPGRPAATTAAAAITSNRGPVDDLLASSPETLPLWIPGVMFLGRGDSKAMVATAKAENIDLLLHFDIALKTNRNEQTQNVSRCRLLSVATNKPLATSKAMDSNEVAQQVRAGRTSERAYVDEQLSNLFMIIDRHVKTTDMPKLTAEVAKRRVGTLLSASPTHRLRALSEVRLYQAQELLAMEDVEMAFEIVGGQDGLALLHGPRDKKLSIARDWVLSAIGSPQ